MSKAFDSISQGLNEAIAVHDPFRLRHRRAIAETIREVVLGKMNKSAAAEHIRQSAPEWVDAPDYERFVEVVETQLLNLHEGNSARFKLRRSEFAEWWAGWG